MPHPEVAMPPQPGGHVRVALKLESEELGTTKLRTESFLLTLADAKGESVVVVPPEALDRCGERWPEHSKGQVDGKAVGITKVDFKSVSAKAPKTWGEDDVAWGKVKPALPGMYQCYYRMMSILTSQVIPLIDTQRGNMSNVLVAALQLSERQILLIHSLIPHGISVAMLAPTPRCHWMPRQSMPGCLLISMLAG